MSGKAHGKLVYRSEHNHILSFCRTLRHARAYAPLLLIEFCKCNLITSNLHLQAVVHTNLPKWDEECEEHEYESRYDYGLLFYIESECTLSHIFSTTLSFALLLGAFSFSSSAVGMTGFLVIILI